MSIGKGAVEKADCGKKVKRQNKERKLKSKKINAIE